MAYVSIAVREYGQGRICLHTDRLGAVFTGHGKNPKVFWRELIGWTAAKTNRELMRVGLVINTQVHVARRINSLNPVQVDNLSYADFATTDLSAYDVLYIVGLTESLSSDVSQQIADFVEAGGGLVIEYPNVAGEINVLSAIESLECYSEERALQTLAYWTVDGSNHPIYFEDADITFMSTMREEDFSDDWTFLMTDVEVSVTTTTTLLPGQESAFDLTGSSGSEFGVSYISSMQYGIVQLEEEPTSSESSSSESTSSSSSFEYSSSSSENVPWDICGNRVAEWRMNDDLATPLVLEQTNNILLEGTLHRNTSRINTSIVSVPGVINRAFDLTRASVDHFRTFSNTYLSFSDGVQDEPFSFSLWVYTTDTGTQYMFDNAAWEVRLRPTGGIHKILFRIKGSSGQRGRQTSATVVQLNQWYHIICTYDGRGGSSAQNGIKIYVDGVEKASVPSNISSYTTMLSSSQVAYIGCRNNRTNSVDGMMDQFVVFDKELNQRDIERLYNLGRGTEECEGLYWNTSSSSESSESSSSSSSYSSSSYSSQSSESSSSSSIDSSSSSSSSSMSSQSSESSSSSSSIDSSSSTSSSSESSESIGNTSSSTSSSSSSSIFCCTEPNCTGDCTHFSNWNFTGMTEENTDNCKWYVDFYQFFSAQYLDLYKDPGMTEYVATGIKVGAGTMEIDDAFGTIGTVDWDGTLENGTAVLEC
jgi:hypothetical protein